MATETAITLALKSEGAEEAGSSSAEGEKKGKVKGKSKDTTLKQQQEEDELEELKEVFPLKKPKHIGAGGERASAVVRGTIRRAPAV